MRNMLKATTLERKFPLLAVENGCIISKDADITVAFMCAECTQKCRSYSNDYFQNLIPG